MKKSKIIVGDTILNRVAQSKILTEKAKIDFLKYVWYMTPTEQAELAEII
jgi:hypothetical protein